MSAPLTILDRSHLERLDQLCAERGLKLSRSARFCAAKLIGIFYRLTQWKQQRYNLPLERCWFWVPIVRQVTPTEPELETDVPPVRSLSEELQGEHGKDAIRRALDVLGAVGLLKWQRNPHRRQDRTYHYQFCCDLLLKPAADQDSATEEKKPPLKGDSPRIKLEVWRMISEIYSYPSPFKQHCAAAEEKKGKGEPTASSTTHTAAPEARSCSSPQEPKHAGKDQFSAALRELKIEANSQVKAAIERYRDRLTDAIGYLRQEVAKGWVERPTGLLIKALREGRKPQQLPPEPVQLPPRFSFDAAESACEMAMSRNDRDFVRSKLQSLCGSGLRPEAERLIDAHPEWCFCLDGEIVEDF
jgi:hypothetical protein